VPLRMLIEEFLIFAGLMATLGCITKIILTTLNRRRAIADGSVTTLNEIAQRLGRLEQAVDATAIEVERIAEGQRFTTKLLAERGHQPVASDSGRGRVVTPH
jgi:hypothetical protein